MLRDSPPGMQSSTPAAPAHHHRAQFTGPSLVLALCPMRDSGRRHDTSVDKIHDFAKAARAGSIPCLLAPKWNIPVRFSTVFMMRLYALMAVDKVCRPAGHIQLQEQRCPGILFSLAVLVLVLVLVVVCDFTLCFPCWCWAWRSAAGQGPDARPRIAGHCIIAARGRQNGL